MGSGIESSMDQCCTGRGLTSALSQENKSLLRLSVPDRSQGFGLCVATTLFVTVLSEYFQKGQLASDWVLKSISILITFPPIPSYARTARVPHDKHEKRTNRHATPNLTSQYPKRR